MNKSSRLILTGAIYSVLGLIALSFASITTIAAVLTLAAVLVVAGIAQVAYGIQGVKTGQLWPHAILGCLAIVAGVIIARDPYVNTMLFTAVIGFMLLVGGLAKVIGAAVERTTGWGYYFLNGVVSMILAAVIFNSYPYSAFWTIGTFVGIDLLVGGLTLIGLGYTLRQTRQEAVQNMNSMLPETFDEIEYEYFHKQNAQRDDDRSGGGKEKKRDKDSDESPTIH